MKNLLTYQSSLPRERLLQKGVECLKDEELIAIILQTGYKGRHVQDCARDVVKRWPVSKLSKAKPDELRQLAGISYSKACTLIAALELGLRAVQAHTSQRNVEKPEDCLPYLHSLSTKKKEYFAGLYLNARNQVVHQEVISIGTVNASLVHPREVFEPAVRCSAASVIIAHNHPSGDVEPSDADMKITQRIVKAGELMGIELIDHLIIAGQQWYSFKQHGML
ncbi:MAG: RadC family protein [Patescibacteria group bacterium]